MIRVHAFTLPEAVQFTTKRNEYGKKIVRPQPPTRSMHDYEDCINRLRHYVPNVETNSLMALFTAYCTCTYIIMLPMSVSATRVCIGVGPIATLGL